MADESRSEPNPSEVASAVDHSHDAQNVGVLSAKADQVIAVRKDSQAGLQVVAGRARLWHLTKAITGFFDAIYQPRGGWRIVAADIGQNACQIIERFFRKLDLHAASSLL